MKKRFQHEGGLSQRGRVQCTATSRRTGKQCQWGAIDGKDKCKHHGGMTGVTTGLYSKYLKGSLKEAIEKVEKEGPQLESELTLLRALLVQTTEFFNLAQHVKLADRLPVWSTMVDLVKDLISEIRSCEETISRIVDKNSITPEQVTIVVNALIKLLSKHVKPEEMKIISADFDRLPWPSRITTLRPKGNGRALLNEGKGNGRNK